MSFVESHDWVDPDGARLAAMRAAAAATHEIATILPGARDIHRFPELRGYREDDLWLMCSEGRPSPMYWLKFTPRD